VRSTTHIRCPKCKVAAHSVDGYYVFEVHDEGTHDVYCPRCRHGFDVETEITRTFVSPLPLKEGE